MKKNSPKKDTVAELVTGKMATNKAKETTQAFSKFIPKRQRNKNNSSVGPSWGGRKGN